MFKITDYFKQANSVKSTEDHDFADLTCSENYLHEGSISSNNNVAGIIMKAVAVEDLKSTNVLCKLKTQKRKVDLNAKDEAKKSAAKKKKEVKAVNEMNDGVTKKTAKQKSENAVSNAADKENKMPIVVKEVSKSKAVGKKQQSLTAFLGETLTNSKLDDTAEATRIITEEERRQKMVQNCTRRFERAILSLDKELFLKIVSTASRLPQKYVDCVPNLFVKYVMQKEIDLQRRAIEMKNLSRVEKAEYKKKFPMLLDKKMEDLLAKFLAEKYEDTKLTMSVELPEVPFVELPANATNSEFGRCLAITGFVSKYRKLFRCAGFNVSAVNLLLALHGDRNEFIQYSAKVVKPLVCFLANDGFKKSLLKSNRCADIAGRCNLSNVFKILSLMLLGRRMIHPPSRLSNDNELFDELSENDDVDQLEESAKDELSRAGEFFELSAGAQLDVMECLISNVLRRDSFNAILEDNSELDTALQELADYEAEMEQIGKELDLLPPPPTEEEQQHMTRMQTAELAKNESMKKRLNQRLEELRITLPDQLQLVKALKLKDRLRTLPLGRDRFHRVYWHFGDSPNEGIFVEERFDLLTRPKEEEKRRQSNSKQDFIISLAEIVNESYPEREKAETTWRHISTSKALSSVLSCLASKGLREGELKKKLNALKDIIFPSESQSHEFITQPAEDEITGPEIEEIP